MIVSKESGVFYPRVNGIKILNKKTNEVLQNIPMDCELRSLHNLSIEDYNFDGKSDFSVFENHYAGPNTSRIYFLYDPQTDTFFNSHFEGVSLDFDRQKKLVYERNQCCGGSIVTNAIFKIIHNRMVLKEEHCYKWDEKRQKIVERKMKDCQ